MCYAVSKILTSRFKEGKIFPGPVTFLWYFLHSTLGLQDSLAGRLSKDISNNHKELLKYVVFQMSCKNRIVCDMSEPLVKDNTTPEVLEFLDLHMAIV